MSGHKFKTGQMITLKNNGLPVARMSGECKIMATLPETGGMRQYRVRFEGETFERCVGEDDIQTSPAKAPQRKPAADSKEKQHG
ncbi:cold-shock protein [Rhizobium halophytocola]|uniref:Cold-shock protein n=1 Tax=Rhizobium halophytocola TaxID=735519 RepID=A0ABS4E1X7_9HYPH|nr:cold-shock protein [Rhizobium halophytocola]MBP1851951.1 hypothetical protein [Rhizobium halophytocola]